MKTPQPDQHRGFMMDVSHKKCNVCQRRRDGALANIPVGSDAVRDQRIKICHQCISTIHDAYHNETYGSFELWPRGDQNAD